MIAKIGLGNDGRENLLLAYICCGELFKIILDWSTKPL